MTAESALTFNPAIHRQFCDDVEYFNSIWDQVSKEHPDSYIAVYRGRVVAVHEVLNDLLAQMDREGVPRNFTVVRYASSKPELWIL